MTYRVVIERLKIIFRIADAVECFHQMTSKLGEEIDRNHENRKWSLGKSLGRASCDVVPNDKFARLQAACC